MSVIAFRPRSARRGVPDAEPAHPAVFGTFRSPTGGTGRLTGSMRVLRLVLGPHGAFVTGVVTGALREDDGTLIGVESRRATVRADLVRDDGAFRPWVRPFELDLMGIAVDVAAFAVEPALALPGRPPATPAPHVTRHPSHLGLAP